MTVVLGPRGLRLLAFLLRPALAPLMERSFGAQAGPGYNDRASFMGPRPLRVLVVGAGLAEGRGAESEPMPTRLARALGAELGSGVIVETRAQASARLDRLTELIGMAGAATFDVVVWSPTLEETVRAGAGWSTRQVRGIVSRFQRSGPPHLEIVLMGVPRVDGPHLLQRLAAASAAEVNGRIERVAAGTDRAEFLPVPARTSRTPVDGTRQRRLVADLVRLLGDRQRRDAARAAAGFLRAADDGVRIDRSAQQDRDAEA